MSLIKKLIHRLLDSRTTPEEAGHNAMPINIVNATNLTMDVGAEGSYTAPADGYLSLMVEPGGNINLWGQILPISSFPIQNVQGKLFVPMAKGMEVRYYINGTVSLAKFLKTIGGGYNNLVRRALSCLRPSFNFSQKVFSRIRKAGLAISLCQRLKTLFFINLRESNGLVLLRQLMVICTSWREIPSVSTLRPDQSHLSLLHTRILWQKFSFQRRRERPSITSFMAVLLQMRQLLLLSTLSVQLNKKLGGALC